MCLKRYTASFEGDLSSYEQAEDAQKRQNLNGKASQRYIRRIFQLQSC
jgi:hypothetical protein